jgi:hypothetical protein
MKLKKLASSFFFGITATLAVSDAMATPPAPAPVTPTYKYWQFSQLKAILKPDGTKYTDPNYIPTSTYDSCDWPVKTPINTIVTAFPAANSGIGKICDQKLFDGYWLASTWVDTAVTTSTPSACQQRGWCP